MMSCRGCIHRRDMSLCNKCFGWNLYKRVNPEFKHTVCGPDISKEMEKVVKTTLNNIFGVKIVERKADMRIEKVIFNAPATIVIWKDGTKTVVKSGDYDVYDPEKGLAMAIAKKALGNQGNYYEVFKQWLPEEYERTSETFKSEITMNGDENLRATYESRIEKIWKLKDKLIDTKGWKRPINLDDETVCYIAIEVSPDRSTDIVAAKSSYVYLLTPVQMARLLGTSDTEIRKKCRTEWNESAKKVNGKWEIPCVIRDAQ